MTIKEFTDELDGTLHIIIEHEDGSTTSMLKSVYDAQVEHLTEIIPSEAKTK